MIDPNVLAANHRERSRVKLLNDILATLGRHEITLDELIEYADTNPQTATERIQEYRVQNHRRQRSRFALEQARKAKFASSNAKAAAKSKEPDSK